MKACPKCAERIRPEAQVCRFCGHTYSASEMQAEAARRVKGRNIAIGISALIGIYLVSTCSFSAEELGEDIAEFEANSAAAAAPATLRIDRFAWESHGDSHCRASATITNTSPREIGFVSLTLQFLQDGQLVASDRSYADSDHIPAGGSSTWDALYRCPGEGSTVDVSAVADRETAQITGL